MAEKTESIRVFVRVRPPFSSELAKESVCVDSGQQTIRLKYDKYDTSCRYNKVFDKDSSQDAVFEHITPLLLDALAGVNCCVLAYGQTSAGKTHTMLGPNGGASLHEAHDDSWGILPRSVSFLFDELRRRVGEDGIKYQVKISYMQIYNEVINDLLRERVVVDELGDVDTDGAQQSSGLRIREYSEGSGDVHRRQEIFVSGLSEFRAETAQDVLRLLLFGSSNRSTRSTECNASSSRSHAILQLGFEIEQQGEEGQTVINRSKLSFVDLAGSEKIITLGNDNNPKHLKELTSINKSLSSLGNVIAALARGRSHIPYRNSKLTRLLQDSLGGNTRTLLIACVAPTAVHAAETFNTLQFADRASSVMLRVRPNVVIDDKALLVRAQVEVARLKRLLRFVMSGSGDKMGGHDSSSLGTEYTSKQSAVLQAMVVGAQAERAGGGDDEAAADSEMIRLLDENEKLRLDNAALVRKCNKLQARLNIHIEGGGNQNQRAGAWSPVRNPRASGHKKTKRAKTVMAKSRSAKSSNPYIAHLPETASTTHHHTGAELAAMPKPRGASTGAAGLPFDAPALVPPMPIVRSPRLVAATGSAGGAGGPFELDALPLPLPSMSRTAPPEGGAGSRGDDVHYSATGYGVAADGGKVGSPVRGVIRKKSKGHLTSSVPSAATAAADEQKPNEEEEPQSQVSKKHSAAVSCETSQRAVAMRNPYASLTPVLRGAGQAAGRQLKRKKKNSDHAQSDIRKSTERSSRIEQVRSSAEWGAGVASLESLEMELDRKGKLLDRQLEEDSSRLRRIQREKEDLLQQLQSHMDSVGNYGGLISAASSIDIRSSSSSMEKGSSPNKKKSKPPSKLKPDVSMLPSSGFSGLVSPTSAGVCRDYFTEVLDAAVAGRRDTAGSETEKNSTASDTGGVSTSVSAMLQDPYGITSMSAATTKAAGRTSYTSSSVYETPTKEAVDLSVNCNTPSNSIMQDPFEVSVPPIAQSADSGDKGAGGSSFSSNVVAKALRGGNSGGASVPSCQFVKPKEHVTNEPARLLNSEMDVGRCLQMYSFRYDSWDTFDILAYNPKEGLHQCQFQSDKTQQWLNLKKKPIRGFAVAPFETVDEREEEDEEG